MKLTARQQQILDLIQRHVKKTGYPPTRSEIAREFGFRSANAAEDHLKALQRKGAIELRPGVSRGIRLRQAMKPEDALPVVGRVAAGHPILAEEHVEEHYRIDADLFHPRADFLLRVSGMSMCEVGIMEGDLLAVHHTPEASNGQIVVARLDDEVTVKRFYRDGRKQYQVELRPENVDFEPILVDLREQNFFIEGLGVGIVRNGSAGFSSKRLQRR